MEDNSDNKSDFSNSEYIREALFNWLCNKPKQAEVFLREGIEKTPILAAYAFVLCMNGIISCEIEKIRSAQEILKVLEKRCLTGSTVRNTNAIRNIWRKTFTKSSDIDNSRKFSINAIEEQIILADAYLLTAVLSFLMEDTSGLLKGSWLLRKAWKIYNKIYCQMYDLYIKYCDDEHGNHPPAPSAYFYLTTSKSAFEMNDHENKRNARISRFVLRPATAIAHERRPSHNQSNEFRSHDSEFVNNSVSSNNPPSRANLHLVLNKNCSNDSDLLTCPVIRRTSFPSPESITTPSQSNACNVDPSEIRRLMGAVNFGYGIFQLCSSLLPSKILKIFSFLGFAGNQTTGVLCLKFCRSTNDMRAMIATLVLLWFYTFGTQIFPNEDGYAKEKVEAATLLLNESDKVFPNAGLLLFFRGRLERMKANIEGAIENFEWSCKHAAQFELKVLCLHEMAWCHLIQLDFKMCTQIFDHLRKCSTFSKAFNSYMTCVCQGASGNFAEIPMYQDEIVDIASKAKYKDMYIMKFLSNRMENLPPRGSLAYENKYYWCLLVYELLYLWSALHSMKSTDLEFLLDDCLNMREQEPMIGLSDLLVGAIASALKRNEMAINAYRECIKKRAGVTDKNGHLTVLSHVELASLLLENNRKLHLPEAKRLLMTAQSIQNYDFESRFNLQVQRELKKLQAARNGH